MQKFNDGERVYHGDHMPGEEFDWGTVDHTAQNGDPFIIWDDGIENGYISPRDLRKL